MKKLMKKQCQLLMCVLMSVSLAACARDFPVSPLTADEQKSEVELRGIDDSDAQLALASMYVLHNRIDDADGILTGLAVKDGKNPRVLAWKAANDCKKVGRRGPWLMGFDKLYLVRGCLADLDASLAVAPDDFVVQMVQMTTAADVDMFGSLERAAATRDRVDAMLKKQPDALPADTHAQFQVVAATIDRKQGQKDKAVARLALAAPLVKTESTRNQFVREQELLATR
ncbi:MAG: hypothetical protein JWL63_1116 [Rhodocyclales bacterium]|nr:hypothetical protein [Rhodocyclales bacterium]